MRIPSSSIGILRFQTISIHMMSRRCIEHTSAEGRSTHYPRQCRRPVCVQSCHSRGVPREGNHLFADARSEMVPLTGNSSFIEEFSPETSPLPSNKFDAFTHLELASNLQIPMRGIPHSYSNAASSAGLSPWPTARSWPGGRSG